LDCETEKSEIAMAKEHKGKSAPAPMKESMGRHGGNRAGERAREAEEPKKSSQSAGKDPHRGEKQERT
jgi:hypothetical protein